MKIEKQLLLIGVGNPLRGDDGVAHKLCNFIAGNDSAFELMQVQQLQPELTDTFLGRKLVIIADASTNVAHSQLVPLEREELKTNSSFSHQLDASLLVKLFYTLHPNEEVQFKLLHLPGFSFEMGEGLSLECEAHLLDGVMLIIQERNAMISTNSH